jgi:hypothetical protein
MISMQDVVQLGLRCGLAKWLARLPANVLVPDSILDWPPGVDSLLSHTIGITESPYI